MTKLTLKKIRFGLLFVWHIAVSYLTPVWLGTVFKCLRGSGSGYGYVAGGEKELYVLFGFMLLFVWLAVFVPSFVWLTGRFRDRDDGIALIPAAVFALFFAAGVAAMGFDVFFSFFAA